MYTLAQAITSLKSKSCLKKYKDLGAEIYVVLIASKRLLPVIMIDEKTPPHCPTCGKLLPEKNKFCPDCGQAINWITPPIYKEDI